MVTIRPELLCQPNIIKPLHGLNPRTLLGQGRWDIERRKAYAKNSYCCMACWIEKSKAPFHQWLEAHEVYDIDFDTHTYKLKEIVPLCHSCHMYIHDWLLSVLHNRWEVSTTKYNRIMKHWESILKKAKIQNRGKLMMDMCKNDVSQWFPEENWTRSDWGLEIDGKKYYTKFKTYWERSNFYNH